MERIEENAHQRLEDNAHQGVEDNVRQRMEDNAYRCDVMETNVHESTKL